jgi:hypothetical protein
VHVTARLAERRLKREDRAVWQQACFSRDDAEEGAGFSSLASFHARGGIMTVQQLEHLADGLSVSACGRTLVIERTRVRRVAAGHDVSFLIAGTDLAPRIHLGRDQLSSSTWEEMSAALRLVAARVACGR